MSAAGRGGSRAARAPFPIPRNGPTARTACRRARFIMFAFASRISGPAMPDRRTTVFPSTCSNIGWSRSMAPDSKHDHDHDHDHPHPPRSDHASHQWERREAALRSLLIEKGILTAEAIRAKIEEWEQK